PARGDGGHGRGMTTRYRLVRREEIELQPALPEGSEGLTRQGLIGEATRSVATRVHPLAPQDGHVHTHPPPVQSSFYVFSGEPVLSLDGRAVTLEPDACGAIPVGLPHAWRADGRAEWIEMMTPRPRGPGRPPDTFFVGPAPEEPGAPLDLRDPRNRN